MKFYEFKNITDTSASLFIYGEIVSDNDDWFGSESDFTLTDFKSELDKLGNIRSLDIFINSPGGEVFAASTMVSMLQRLKDKGTYITSYVDGLSASAASFLMMVANEIKLYKNSVVMVHKPMSIAFGNADDMQKTIDALNKIEDSVLIPMYMDKAKSEEKTIKKLINDETWLNASDMDKHFNVTIIDSEKLAVASVKSDLFKNYKNVPDFIKNSLEEEDTEETTETIVDENIDDVVEINTDETIEIDEGEVVNEGETKETEIKAKLGLIKSSIILKKLKEKGED